MGTRSPRPSDAEVSAGRTPLGRTPGSRGPETRERILAATMRCVAEVGYARATIREIAKAADMTSGSLYHYFPNKAALVEATFLELSGSTVPRLAAAANAVDGVVDKLMAVLDESDQLMRDYPYASAFDRALRVESGDNIHLVDSSDTVFNALQNSLLDILGQAERDGSLNEAVSVQAASDAVFAIVRGLNEHAATAPEANYHATVRALKLLIGGTLFDYDKIE